MDAGPAGGAVFEGALRSSQLHGLPHEVMDGTELHRRFPGYRLPREMRCLYQPEGGFLLPERCNVAHLVLAHTNGAEVHCREPVLQWGATGDRVWVRTTRGHYEAGRLVICAGPWASRLVPALDGLAVPQRQVLAWLQPARPEAFRPDAFPAGFSGHGYKFCSVIGEIMADLGRDGQTRHDIEFFRLKRFGTAPYRPEHEPRPLGSGGAECSRSRCQHRSPACWWLSPPSPRWCRSPHRNRGSSRD